jgi:hypothetical protein
LAAVDAARRAQIAAVLRAAQEHEDRAVALVGVAHDLDVVRMCLTGACSALSARSAIGRLGELILVARSVAEGETPLRTGVRGGSDLIALSDAGQLVAREAKATAAKTAHVLPPSVGDWRLGRAWSIDPATGVRVRARQGTIPYTGRDAVGLGLPVDAGENLPYRLLFVSLRADDPWGASDWYSIDIRRDPERRRLYAHGESRRGSCERSASTTALWTGF